MSLHHAKRDIHNTLGKPDGVCAWCGSPAQRMGWLNYPTDYWRMCTASMEKADEDEKYGHCTLPSEDAARRRLGHD